MIRLLASLALVILIGGPARGDDQPSERGIHTERVDPQEKLAIQLSTDRYAIVIGVDQYLDESIPPLTFCRNDTEALAESLVEDCGFEASHVRVLVDEEATRLNILQALGLLGDRDLYPSPDTLVVYFSGHGVNIDDGDFLIPTDGSLDPSVAEDANVPLDRVLEKLEASGFPRRMVFIDACRRALPTGTRGVAGFSPEAYALYQETAGMKVLFSTSSGSVARESPTLEHGVFTYYLLEGLRGKACDDDGLVTFGSLETYVQGCMREYSLKLKCSMRPQLPVTSGEGSSDMILAVTEPPGTDNVRLAEQLRLKGVELFKDKDYDASIVQFKASVALDPNCAEGYCRLGGVYYLTDRYEELLAAYQEALRLDPENACAHTGLGLAYHLKGQKEEAAAEIHSGLELDPNNLCVRHVLADAYTELGRHEEAIAVLEEGIQLEPWDFSEYDRLSDLYVDLERNERALAVWQQAADANPAEGWPHAYLGFLYERFKQLGQAKAAYEVALALDPTYAWAYRRLAYLLADLDRTEEAILLMETAAQANPDASWPLERLGYYLQKEERYEEAIIAYETATTLAPDEPGPFEELGGIYRHLGQSDKAEAAYAQAIRLYEKAVGTGEVDESTADECYYLAELYRELGRTEDAVAAYQRVYTYDYGFYSVHRDLAEYYEELGRPEDAVAVWRETIGELPDRSWPHVELGHVYSRQKMHEQALAEYDQAIELDPEAASAPAGRGEALRMLGRLDEAIESLSEALKVDPEYPDAHTSLGMAYFALGDYEGAQQALTTALELSEPGEWAFNTATEYLGKIE